MFEVESVQPGSPAHRGGVRSGDVIVSVNGEKLLDYVDYVYFCAQNRLKLRVLRGGVPVTLRLTKTQDEDIGLSFRQPLLGEKHLCGNRCVFCFVHQLPRGMRRSLYVKDEDWRYSLIMGNYITLSMVSKSEISRIIRRKASPLYISVHTVDEALRRRMLGNEKAAPIRPLLKKFARHGIRFHTQAVICPGYNDGEKLEETIRFLASMHPAAMSLAVVPVGLTGHRAHLPALEPVSPAMARDTIKMVEKWQRECLNRVGTRFVFAADEYYIRAGLPLPPLESYEALWQIENGVGMMAVFLDEAEGALARCKKAHRRVSIATGQDAYPFIRELAAKAGERCGVQPYVYMVRNVTFGGGVTVSGLLAGRDYVEALSGKPLGDALLIPANSLREDNVFLDDMTLAELSGRLGVCIEPVMGGAELVAHMTGGLVEEENAWQSHLSPSSGDQT